MKILKMLGLVVAVHVVVLTFGFILPGCQSTVRTSPSTGEKPAPSNMSRIDAARAGGTVSQTPAPVTTTHTPAPSNPHTPSPVTPANTFAGGPVADFGVPVPELAPTRPQAAAENLALPADQTANDAPAALTYTVLPGDSLWKIAKKFKTTTASITAANNLAPSASLQVGQKIKIPAKVVSQANAITPPAGTMTYKVKANDSLATIARRNNTTVEQIQTLNKLAGTSIRIDQELLVPIATDTATTTPTPAATTQPAATNTPATTIVHTVKPGESLDSIARYYGASRNEIGTTNHITNPNHLKIGQKLTITSAKKNLANATLATAPASTTTTTTTTATTAPAPQPTQTTPPPAPVETSPVSPVSPVIESPITPTPADNPFTAPPVNTPQDPTSPIDIPQN